MLGTDKSEKYDYLSTSLLIVCLLLESAVRPPKISIQAEPYLEETNFVKYQIKECTELALNNTLSLSFYSVLFTNSTPYQEVALINSSSPITQLVHDIHGNTIAGMYFSNLLGQQELRITFSFEITTRALHYSLSEDVGVYDPSSSLFEAYTINETHIESANPKIVLKAREIVGAERNAYRASRLIFRWVHDNIKYEIQDEEMGALWALENRKGDCSEFSFLFTALCRAVGIPARVTSGVADPKLPDGGFFPDWKSMGAHQWAEVYFPNCGWIWVDPTWDQFADSDAMHIAHIRTEFAQYKHENHVFHTSWIGWHYEGENVSLNKRTYELFVSDIDSDLDGLTNAEEAKKGTNGLRPDTDYDLWGDKIDWWPTDFFLPNIYLLIAIVPIISLMISWLKARRSRLHASSIKTEI